MKQIVAGEKSFANRQTVMVAVGVGRRFDLLQRSPVLRKHVEALAVNAGIGGKRVREAQNNRFADAAGLIAAVDDAEGTKRSIAGFDQFQRVRLHAGSGDAERFFFKKKHGSSLHLCFSHAII